MSTLVLLASLLLVGILAAAAIWLAPRCQRRQAHFRALSTMEERYRGQLKHRDGLQYHADWCGRAMVEFDSFEDELFVCQFIA